MILGLFFAFLTGLQYTITSVTVSRTRHQQGDACHFYLAACAEALICILLFRCIFPIQLLPASFSPMPYLLVFAGSLFNVIANAIVMYFMGFGASALYMALCLLGFSISFLWSVIFMHESFSAVNAIGLFFLITAIFLTKCGKKGKTAATEDTASQLKRLPLVLLATFCGGLAQIFFMIPCKSAPLPPLGKSAAIMASYLIIWAFVYAAKKEKRTPLSPASLFKVTLPWGISAVTAYFTLFLAMTCLEPLKRSGVTFPVAVTTQIIFFSLYTRIFLKEKLTLMQKIAMLLIILGIFAIRA